MIDASKGIFVPRGVANGFQVLSDKVAYSYLVNDYWALELKPKYAFVNYADPSLDIQWENLEEAEVSEADKNPVSYTHLDVYKRQLFSLRKTQYVFYWLQK